MGQLHRLTALKVSKATKPGWYADGGNLYLQVAVGGTKSWLLRYTFAGKPRALGLGPCHTVSLAEAREAALQARKQIRAGIDPLAQKRAVAATQAAQAAKAMTFKEAAAAYVADQRAGWKRAGYEREWMNSLRDHAFPTIGNLSVSDIDTPHIMKVLQPMWSTKTETASRVRSRIEAVLTWATVRKFRSGTNPAVWKGHLEALLPSVSKTKTVTHMAAMPYVEVGAFMAELEAIRSSKAWALRFLILTAARSGEVLKATWDEIDLARGMWVIPKDRMKAKAEHRVALSKAAVALLKDLPRHGEYLFPSAVPGKPLDQMAMISLLRRMGRKDLTVHGFRSTFRDWAAEQTNFPRELAEMALAHSVGSEVEQAYRRSDLFEKRRRLADAWASYISKPAATGTVTPIRQVADA